MMGWFFSFKICLIVSDTDELLDFALAVDDQQPIPDLVRHVFGKLFGDKGYLSESLHDKLWHQGLISLQLYVQI